MQQSYELDRTIRNELEPGEQVLWTGQPMPGRAWLQTLPLVLFGIPWTAFALFWTFAAAGGLSGFHGGPGIFFALFGVPFILVGFGMLSAPFWAGRKAGQTVYAVTDRRAIIVSAGMWRTVKSYPLSEMSEVERRERGDGSGDLLFAWSAPTGMYRGSSNTSNMRPGFYGVQDVRRVEQALLGAMEQHGRPVIRQ